MDKKNEQLIELLKSNARAATSELARKLELSRTAVHERLVKLQDQGIIRSFTVQLGSEYQKRKIQAEVMIEINPKMQQQGVASLKRIDQIRALHTISGEYDLIARIEAESTEDIDTILDKIGEIEGIGKTISSILLSTKFER